MAEHVPQPTIPACITARMFIEHPRYVMSNTFFYTADVYPDNLNGLRLIGNVIFAAWVAALKPLYGETVHFRGCFLTRQTGSGSSMEDFTSTGSGFGDITAGTEVDESSTTSGNLPAETALIIKKLTNAAGPAKRGRWFFGGVHEDVQVNGLIHQDFKAKVLTVCSVGASDLSVPAGSGYAGSALHARHWNRKDNQLMPIAACRAVIDFGTRRQRRSPKPVNLILT